MAGLQTIFLKTSDDQFELKECIAYLSNIADFTQAVAEKFKLDNYLKNNPSSLKFITNSSPAESLSSHGLFQKIRNFFKPTPKKGNRSAPSENTINVRL